MSTRALSFVLFVAALFGFGSWITATPVIAGSADIGLWAVVSSNLVFGVAAARAPRAALWLGTCSFFAVVACGFLARTPMDFFQVFVPPTLMLMGVGALGEKTHSKKKAH